MSNETKYDGLLHSYSVTYPKTMWLFKNPPHFKFWNWLFTQYVYQTKMKLKYPNPCKINIPRTYLESYLGLSKSTIKKCVAHMIDIGVLTKKSNSSAHIFDAPYALGVIAMVNEATDDEIMEIETLFSDGDREGLKELGFKELFGFNIPTVSALEADEKGHNIPQIDEKGHNIPHTTEKGYIIPQNDEKGYIIPHIDEEGHIITLLEKNGYIITHPTEKGHNITQSDEKGLYYNLFNVLVDEKGLYYNPSGSENNPLGHNITSLLDEINENWTGEVKLCIEEGNLTGISTNNSENGSKDDEKWVIIKPSMGYNKTFMGYNKTFMGYNMTPINNINKEIKENKSKTAETLEAIDQKLNVLLAKNQTSFGEPEGSNQFDDSSSFFGDISGERYGDTQSEEKDERGNFQTCYDKYGEIDSAYESEIAELRQEQFNHPLSQNVIRTLKAELEEGTQITCDALNKKVKEIIDEIFMYEYDNPETGELEVLPYAMTPEIEIDPDDPYVSDDRKERYWERREILETMKVMRTEYDVYLEHFHFEGTMAFVHWRPTPVQSYEERLAEFTELHENYEHEFPAEDLELEDYEKAWKVVFAFNEKFPENEKFLVSEMVLALQYMLVDIGLFQVRDVEWNNYGVLHSFKDSIRTRLSDGDTVAERLPFKTADELFIERTTECAEERRKSYREAVNAAKSDSLDYGELLTTWKPPRIKLSPEGFIPANPALKSALEFLQMTNGQYLEEWEVDQICTAVVRKYNKTGYGQGEFTNAVYYFWLHYDTNKYEIKNLENVAENATENDTEKLNADEEAARNYVPRPRTRRRRQ